MAWRRICTLVEHEAPQRDTKATPAIGAIWSWTGWSMRRPGQKFPF